MLNRGGPGGPPGRGGPMMRGRGGFRGVPRGAPRGRFPPGGPGK